MSKRKRENPYKDNPYFVGPNKKRSKRGQKHILARIEKKKKLEAINGESYSSRNNILHQIGFSTHKDYLKSDLWAKIRKKVLKESNETCELCSCKATQVHHSRYHKNDLLGRNLKFLHAVCNSCHYKIEFQKGEKLTLKEAAQKQRDIKSSQTHQKHVEKYVQEKYGYLDDEFNSMFMCV